MKNTPILFSGAPGVGKTAMAYAAGRGDKRALSAIGASEIEREIIYLPLCERDPMEIAGASYLSDPDESGNRVVNWAQSAAMRSAQERPCIVILDELTAAHRVQRVAALRYADPSSGLHRDTIVIGTCNPPEYAAGAGEPLSAPEISRFRIRNQGPEGAVRWMCAQPGQVGLVGRFLRAQPRAALADAKAMQSAVDRQAPYATPRGWTRAAESGLSVDDWDGLVGVDGPPQFLVWRDQQDLPDPTDILAGRSLEVPKRPDSALATATAVIEMLGEDNENASQISAAIAWIDEASKYHAGVISPEADILAERYMSAVYRAAKAGALKRYSAIQKQVIGK